MNDEGAARDGRPSVGSSPRHRRPGQASTNRSREPKPPVTFGQVLRDDPRELLAVAVGTMLALILGTTAVVNGTTLGDRALGVAAVSGAVLLVVSYGFRFRRGVVLDGPAWTRTRPRRVGRFVLMHAWGMFFNVAFVVFLVIAARRWSW